MIDPRKTVLFIPANLKAFKLNLFKRIAARCGGMIHGEVEALSRIPDDVVPIVGCSPELSDLIRDWQREGRPWIYWDRGYCRRVFATDLPVGANGGYYRWHVNSYQMQKVREDLPDDRWRSLDTPVWDWKPRGEHIVIAEPSPTYMRFHGIEGWTERTIERLKQITKRPIRMRDKEMQRDVNPRYKRLRDDLAGAHCLVTHGSNAAVEAVFMGCPVFVDPSSAAALVGQTDLDKIEEPIYPSRNAWLHSLAYNQYNEAELEDGTLWSLLS